MRARDDPAAPGETEVVDARITAAALADRDRRRPDPRPDHHRQARARRAALRECARRTARRQPDAGARGVPAPCNRAAGRGPAAARHVRLPVRRDRAPRDPASCARCSRRERLRIALGRDAERADRCADGAARQPASRSTEPGAAELPGRSTPPSTRRWFAPPTMASCSTPISRIASRVRAIRYRLTTQPSSRSRVRRRPTREIVAAILAGDADARPKSGSATTSIQQLPVLPRADQPRGGEGQHRSGVARRRDEDHALPRAQGHRHADDRRADVGGPAGPPDRHLSRNTAAAVPGKAASRSISRPASPHPVFLEIAHRRGRRRHRRPALARRGAPCRDPAREDRRRPGPAGDRAALGPDAPPPGPRPPGRRR